LCPLSGQNFTHYEPYTKCVEGFPMAGAHWVIHSTGVNPVNPVKIIQN
jgi:hypothetical protein